MRFKDVLKNIIRDELQKIGPSSKYRISTVLKLQSDGTCLAMLDGNAVTATPLYPVVMGQEVMLIFGDGGKVSAVPTKPNTPPVSIIIPPYFTGGGTRFVTNYTGQFRSDGTFNAPIAGTSAPIALGFQDAGNTDSYILIIFNPSFAGNPPANPNLNVRFSPNGQYVVFLGKAPFDANLNPPNTYFAQVYKLGQKLSTNGTIYNPGNTPRLLGMNPVLVHSTTRMDTADPTTGAVTTITDAAVDNAGNLYFIEAVATPPQPYSVYIASSNEPATITPSTSSQDPMGLAGHLGKQLSGFLETLYVNDPGVFFKPSDGTLTSYALDATSLSDNIQWQIGTGADGHPSRIIPKVTAIISGHYFNIFNGPGYYTVTANMLAGTLPSNETNIGTVTVGFKVFSDPASLKLNLWRVAATEGLLFQYNVPRMDIPTLITLGNNHGGPSTIQGSPYFGAIFDTAGLIYNTVTNTAQGAGVTGGSFFITNPIIVDPNALDTPAANVSDLYIAYFAANNRDVTGVTTNGGGIDMIAIELPAAAVAISPLASKSDFTAKLGFTLPNLIGILSLVTSKARNMCIGVFIFDQNTGHEAPLAIVVPKTQIDNGVLQPLIIAQYAFDTLSGSLDQVKNIGTLMMMFVSGKAGTLISFNPDPLFAGIEDLAKFSINKAQQIVIGDRVSGVSPNTPDPSEPVNYVAPFPLFNYSQF